LGAGHCHGVVVRSVTLAGDVVAAATVIGNLGGGRIVVWVAEEGELDRALAAAGRKSSAGEAALKLASVFNEALNIGYRKSAPQRSR
jgi:hypothetical protein